LRSPSERKTGRSVETAGNSKLEGRNRFTIARCERPVEGKSGGGIERKEKAAHVYNSTGKRRVLEGKRKER